MPTITAALKSFSDIIVAHRQKIIVFLILGILLLFTYGATEKGKRKMYKFMLNFPLV
jgi:type II secretory pathway component PulF